MVKIEKYIIETLREYDNGDYLRYINEKILPKYTDKLGHSIDHIVGVLNRAFNLNRNLKLNLDSKVLSAAVFYHDIERGFEYDNHEITSAATFMSDQKMKEFFSDAERKIIKLAIEDHRASCDHIPRNIYGKLLSSADRNSSHEHPLKRTYEYRINRNSSQPIEEIIHESYSHLQEKFGKSGYANKVYFDDGAYEKHLSELRKLLSNYEKFRKEYIKVNQIKITS